jgi:proline dehydrogenase
MLALQYVSLTCGGLREVSIMRTMLLAAAQNRWLRDHASHYKFVRRTVSRFMPGESLEDALASAQTLLTKNIATLFTHLGENIATRAEAEEVTHHYLKALNQIHQTNHVANPLQSNAQPGAPPTGSVGAGLDSIPPPPAMEISVKLTQLGLDLDADPRTGICYDNLRQIIERENKTATLWIDMESSEYVDRTFAVYKKAQENFGNIGICLQAYLKRTKNDLENLLPLQPAIRLVKGAYNEPPTIAFANKSDVDENYFALATQMLQAQKTGACQRAAFGTHDVPLIHRLANFAATQNIPKQDFEVQMLYGIQRAEQERLAAAGHRSAVLVAYGTFWYPWFVRRLAERPANLWFMLRNLFAN